MSYSQIKTLLDNKACEQKRCIMPQPLLKSKVWHDNKLKSQLCDPTTNARAISHKIFVCGCFLTVTRHCDNLITRLNVIKPQIRLAPMRMFEFFIVMVAFRSQQHGPFGALMPWFAGLLDVISGEVRGGKR
jgi:hypothetical protein